MRANAGAHEFLTTSVYGLLFLNTLLVDCVDGATAAAAAARILHKRDTPLVTVNIPLTVNQDQRYVVGVNMSSSPDTQRFKFALAANTGYSAVAGTACNGCDGVPTYNASASSSQRPFPGSQNVTIGSATISGPFIKENCGLQEVNGSAWQYPNQTIIVANDTSSLFSEVTSGLIGLGTNANGETGDFSDTVFGGWLTRNPTHDNFTLGMNLQPPTFTSDDDEGNGGLLHWVVPDSSAYEGPITWNIANTSSAAVGTSSTDGVSGTTLNSGLELPESDWTIELDGWAASISGASVASSNKSQALIEPFFPDIYFPVSQANIFYSAVPSSVKLDSLVGGAQAWNIPCGTELSVSFTFSGQAFPIDQNQLIVKQSDGTCVGAIQAWPDSSVNSFLLGSNFISAFYLIFVAGRPGSDNPNSIGMAMRTIKPSPKPIGAIIGGTIGGVVFLVILSVAAFMIGRRSTKRTVVNPAPPGFKIGETEKLYVDNEGTEDDNVQYAVVPIVRTGKVQLPTPPTTARSVASSYPLLPEAQSPQSPALIDVLSPSMSSLPSSRGRSEVYKNVFSHISYNNSAIGANFAASHAATSYAGSQNYGVVEPFILPAMPTLPDATARAQPSAPKDSSSPHWQHSQVVQLQAVQPARRYALSNSQDIDPLSPSTASVNGTIVPFILPPTLGARRVGKTSIALPYIQRQGDTAAAPPYTAQDGVEKSLAPMSPTLVEYNCSTGPYRSSIQTEER
ncbi:acid protease [Phellopilus nigrolimitatus]|nr:acid protease [Phellopilus nigrolimitatus]